jgi:TPR repeat protein
VGERTLEIDMVRTMRQALGLIQGDSAQGIVDGYAFLLRQVLRGDTAALDSLGSMLTYGVGVECNLRLAAACYVAASSASHTGAAYNLASAFIEGAGVPKNIQKGLRLLRAAARAGETSASNYLGYCYRVGKGVKKDPRRGFALSLKAAEAGVAAAQYDVGMCFLAGNGVEKNFARAQDWIYRAARKETDKRKTLSRGASGKSDRVGLLGRQSK